MDSNFSLILRAKKWLLCYRVYMTDVTEITSLLINPTQVDLDLIRKAYEFAKKSHEGQSRKSGEPYFVHVFETGKTLAKLNMDPGTIVAGLLHDTIEDTGVSEETIKNEFGEEVLFLVEGVTKLGKLKYQGTDRHVESLRKFFIAMAHDVRVVMIKLADRLHNVKTLEFVPKEKQKRIALETLEIHARLADRLGMGQLKTELEDYSFPYAYPEAYEEVKKMLEEKKYADGSYIQKTAEELEFALLEEGVKDAKVDRRVKHLYSLWLKLKRYDMDIEKIYDIIALRVIVSSLEDCYRALGIIHRLWKPLPGRIKDYIAVPKPNGYRSLHTTIFTGDGGTVEIQIRTEDMHKEAEYGVASHIMYKEIGKGTHHTKEEAIKKKTSWTQELIEWQKEVKETGEFFKHLQMDFFENRVFVFTPKGDVIDLPEESSPIDFAYAIHTDIGNHTAGAKVNGRLVSLDTKLKRGDIVEITTKESAHPNRKWLDYVKTTMARKRIASYLEQTNPIKRLLGR